MSEHTAPTPSPITPHLSATPAADAIAFYERAFGATLLFRMDTPDGKKIVHSSLSINGGVLMLCDDFSDDPTPAKPAIGPRSMGITLHLNVADVDAAWKRAVDAGALVVMPLDDQFWGDRYGILADPFGHRWSMSTPVKKATDEELRAGGEKYFPPKKEG